MHLSEVGAKPDTKQVEDGPDGEDKLTEAEEEAKTEHIETESEHSEVNKIMGALSSYIDDDGVSELGKFEDADGEVSIEQVTLKLVDRREPIEVSVEDLDAEFEINFVEGGRTGPPGPPGAPPQGGAPQGGAPEGGASPDLAQIASLPPEQAIPLLRQVFANDPEMLATIDQLAQLPPEQQAQMLANAVGGPPQMPGM